jgi:hypothetical protein
LAGGTGDFQSFNCSAKKEDVTHDKKTNSDEFFFKYQELIWGSVLVSFWVVGDWESVLVFPPNNV